MSEREAGETIAELNIAVLNIVEIVRHCLAPIRGHTPHAAYLETSRRCTDALCLQEAELTRLRALIAEMRGALEPFAKIAEQINRRDATDAVSRNVPPTPDTSPIFVTLGDLRRARSTLEKKA